MENSQITPQILSVSHTGSYYLCERVYESTSHSHKSQWSFHLDVSFIGCHCANLHAIPMTSISELRIICSCTCYSFVCVFHNNSGKIILRLCFQESLMRTNLFLISSINFASFLSLQTKLFSIDGCSELNLIQSLNSTIQLIAGFSEFNIWCKCFFIFGLVSCNHQSLKSRSCWNAQEQ